MESGKASNLDSMKTDTRRRILVTDTPAISALIAQHAQPREARAATLVRLAQRGAQIDDSVPALPVLRGFDPKFMTMNATDILDDEDDRITAEAIGG